MYEKIPSLSMYLDLSNLRKQSNNFMIKCGEKIKEFKYKIKPSALYLFLLSKKKFTFFLQSLIVVFSI